MTQELPDAPTAREDGSPLKRYRIAMTVLIDTHGLDEGDASYRALAALRVPSGPFPQGVDHVSGPGQRWTCHGDVVHAQALTWRELEDE